MESTPAVRWQTLEWPGGPKFPPAYEPHGVKLLYDGEPVDLTPDQEEVASFYASLIDTDCVRNEVFNKNFFSDFRAVLSSTPSTHARVVRLDLCDFGPIHAHLAQQREARCQARADPKERQALKAERERERQRHGVALVDGEPAPVANWQIEPPGLFRGRGQHPQAGRLKPRVVPESITLNLGRSVEPPQPGGGDDEAMAGREWGAVVHDQSVTWLARWRDHVTGLNKFIFISPTAAASARARDRERFEAARQLNAHIEAIREAYMEDLSAADERQWQCATALWLIDHAGLRVGSEKSAESDTVGCCSLFVEHVRCDEATSTVHLDFLGKDSLRYRNTIEVPPLVFARLQRMLADKQSKDYVFDRLNAINVTTRLKELMPGLTASRLRIFNNSSLLQHELSKPLPPDALSLADKLLHYNEANRRVAVQTNRASPGCISTGSMMMHYLDPRITVAWAKRHDVPVEKILGKSMREKVAWALDEASSFEF